MIDWSHAAPAAAPSLQRPGSCAEVLALQRRLGADASCIAGGTALQLAWGVAEEERPGVSVLIDLLSGAVAADIGEGVLADGKPVLRLGAGARLETLRRDRRVRAGAPRLAQALDAIGAPGVRHLATLGGNIGWTCGDALPALLAADATVVLAEGPVLPLADVLDAARTDRRPVALITEIRWPLRRAACAGWSVYEKVGWRAAFSPSRLTLALEARSEHGVIADARVAVTAAGWPARRLAGVEAFLRGRRAATLGDQAQSLREACAIDVDDPGRSRLLARLLVGHLAREAALHG